VLVQGERAQGCRRLDRKRKKGTDWRRGTLRLVQRECELLPSSGRSGAWRGDIARFELDGFLGVVVNLRTLLSGFAEQLVYMLRGRTCGRLFSGEGVSGRHVCKVSDGFSEALVFSVNKYHTRHGKKRCALYVVQKARCMQRERCVDIRKHIVWAF
jgi:hypothetical protein